MPDANTDCAINLLPIFSAMRPTEIVGQLTELLDQNRRDIKALLELDGEITWDRFFSPFEDIDDRLSRFWSPIRHLHSVADNEDMRDAYREAVIMLSEYSTELAQSDRLSSVFRSMSDSAGFEVLTSAQQKVIENALRDFRLGGIDLDEANRERLRAVSTELAQLTTQFSENVLDATEAWDKNVTDKAELIGLPESILGLIRQNAAKLNREGYTLTLDYPCYGPVMSYCDNRDLRREMYNAYVTRASDQGPTAGRFDNTENIDQILALRNELANLVGYPNYAEYSIATKMATSTGFVREFLEDLVERSTDAAHRDFDQLTKFATDELNLRSVEPWDVAYCGEKLRQHAFAFSAEELRPYFPVTRVVEGLFNTVSRLFGITVSALPGVDLWHPDVQVYEVRDDGGMSRGIFYLDLYAREHKRGGAWMDECVVRRSVGGSIQSPVAYLTCNFTPPFDGEESLLTHDEVLTLFHEFGHGLHHLLTLVDHAPVSGINGVPWDGVELPSQFLENWVWEREALDTISGHYQTGKAIPDELFRRMCEAKNFQSGLQMVRQLEFALFDFLIHAEYSPEQSVQEILDNVRRRVAVVNTPSYNRFQHGFSHIFAGGYAAGYYSYKWAEVLSADAFSRFEEEGVFNSETGKSFRESILERGGSEDLLVLFTRFRGRGPTIEPLLRQAGLST